MASSAVAPLSRPAWVAIACLTLAGLALRILAARGGLWTDEAWSAVYAAGAGDALGVFLRINHDNNHHLNSLWLQLVGLDAEPMLARALSILAGTLAIPLAALIGARRGAAEAIAVAALFAVAPIMVTYGSEARGYVLLVLAILAAILLVDRWLDDPARRPPAAALAAICVLGLLGHLTMAIAAGILAIWTYLALRDDEDARHAARAAARLWLPAVIASGLVLALIAAAALASETGPRIGGLHPFTYAGLGKALGQLLGFTLGPVLSPLWLLAFAGAGTLAAFRIPRLGHRRFLYLVAILALPALVLLLRPGNAQFARYYLVTAIALLLLASDLAGHWWRSGGWRRGALLALLGAGLVTGLWRDAVLIAERRGDPDAAVRAMAARMPGGARLRYDVERMSAVMRLAARRLDYPLHRVRGCGRADFLLAVPPSGTRPPPMFTDRCGERWRAVAARSSTGLSGEGWALYAPQALQRSRTPVSGPPPIG